MTNEKDLSDLICTEKDCLRFEEFLKNRKGVKEALYFNTKYLFPTVNIKIKMKWWARILFFYKKSFIRSVCYIIEERKPYLSYVNLYIDNKFIVTL